MNILLGVIIFAQVLQLIFLAYIGAFLYRFKKDTGILLFNLLELFPTFNEVKKPVEEEQKSKTWDQKYEEELSVAEKLRRENLKALQDVPNSRF